MRSAALVVLLASALLVRTAATRPAAERVTFSETIAPILYANCVTCHRQGEAAPFPLIAYDDAAKRGRLIAEVTQSRYMPPWKAVHGYGEFVGERRLTDEQIAAIATWVRDGMPRGDVAKMPSLPAFADGWQLGKPDLILEMPEGFEVPASGPDVYRNFALPTGLAEDRWVRAVEYRPSARRVVHHALFGYIRGGAVKDIAGSDGQPGFRGLAPVAFFPGFAPAGELGGWAVGATPQFQPEGLSMALPKNSDFVLQLHFHPTGKPETERSRVGLYFADVPPDRKLMTPGVPGLFGLLANIDIPPGEKHYTIDGHLTLVADMRVYGADAHAHYLGKEMKATATLPDGSTRPLLWINDWDFNWQDRYIYKEPILLPKGTRIDVTIAYDNSADNPRNPNSPPKRVLWGVQSFDEMGIVRFQMAVANKEDEPAVQAFMVAAVKAAIGQAVKDGTLKRLGEEQRKLKGGGNR